jgi:hypothetical protein
MDHLIRKDCLREYKMNDYILVAVVKPRCVDGRAFGGFQPIFDVAVGSKYGSLC